jgi:hypothetical protein
MGSREALTTKQNGSASEPKTVKGQMPKDNAVAKVNVAQFDLFFTQDESGTLVDVFHLKNKEVDETDTDGNVIGKRIASQTYSLRTLKEINDNLGLTKKDADRREEMVITAKDQLKKKIALMMTMMASDDSWTGSSAKITKGKGKNGKVRVQFTLEQIERKLNEIERLAKAYGKSPEEILAMIRSQLDSQKEKLTDTTTEVETTTTTEAEEVKATEETAKE